MQLTRLILIRHGETAWNRDARIQGSMDIALNDIGRMQAQRLWAALADEALAAVYSSDLQRARQTAEGLAQARGLALQIDPGLGERRFGSFEGQRFVDLEQQFPEDTLRWRRRDPDFGPPGGERLSDFYTRCVAAVERIAQAHAGDCVALVTHGGVLDCLYRAATKVDLQAPRTWTIANASINRLLWHTEGLSLVGWGDVGHLDGQVLDTRVLPQSAALDETSDGSRTSA